MAEDATSLIRVGTLDEIKTQRMVVVRGDRGPILVCYDGGRIFAVDNRCPHLGFPLNRGTVEDGILTCHWHHARFDIASGGTFDLWADDLSTAPVTIRDGEVWIAAHLRYGDGDRHWDNRMRCGLEHNIALVIAKAVLGQLAQGTDYRRLVRGGALFGARNRDDWGSGLSILTALGNLIPILTDEDTFLALYCGLSRVAEDCEATAPHREREPLDGPRRSISFLAQWLRHWTRVRHRDGIERTLLTAVSGDASPAAIAELLLVAATDRYFADGGHTLDFANKALECLDIIGWTHARELVASLAGHLASARGAEESNAWRHPIDLVSLCGAVFERLPALISLGAGSRGAWQSHAGLAAELLGDDPANIVAALTAAISDGAELTDLSRALAYASALRVARFGISNEHSDWLSAHHCFTYCNALHQILRRISIRAPQDPVPDALVYRGLFHGAMQIYLLRFLNVPPARMPDGSGEQHDGEPATPSEICRLFLLCLDRQGSVDEAARLIMRYFALGTAPGPLLETLVQAPLREDADFHTYQMLEAGLRQYNEWGAREEGRNILVAVARYLAAHSPTERSKFQTAMIARRLSRGLALHEEEAGSSVPAAPS